MEVAILEPLIAKKQKRIFTAGGPSAFLSWVSNRNVQCLNLSMMWETQVKEQVDLRAVSMRSQSGEGIFPGH